MRITRISLTGLATVSATANTILMLLLSLCFIFGGVTASAVGLPLDMLDEIDEIDESGTVAFIVLTILYFIATWIVTAIWALIFNLALTCTGGFYIETSE